MIPNESPNRPSSPAPSAEPFRWPKFDLSDPLAFKASCVQCAGQLSKTWEEIAKIIVDGFNKQTYGLVELAKVFADIKEQEAQRQAELTRPRTRRVAVALDG